MGEFLAGRGLTEDGECSPGLSTVPSAGQWRQAFGRGDRAGQAFWRACTRSWEGHCAHRAGVPCDGRLSGPMPRREASEPMSQTQAEHKTGSDMTRRRFGQTTSAVGCAQLVGGMVRLGVAR